MRYLALTRDQSINAFGLYGSGGSWAEAVEDYETQTHFVTSGTHLGSSVQSGTPTTYTLSRCSFVYDAYAYYTATAYVDWYVKAVKGGYDAFHAQGYNVTEDTFSLIYTGAQGVTTFSLQDPDGANSPSARPASGSAGWQLVSPWWVMDDYKPVARYDFMFKNW